MQIKSIRKNILFFSEANAYHDLPFFFFYLEREILNNQYERVMMQIHRRCTPSLSTTGNFKN